MANRAIAGIVSAASLAVVNDIFQYAFGWGPGNFSIPLSSNGEDPATHYGLYAASVPEAEAITLQQLCDGVMPEAEWGDEGLPSEQDAIDACTNGNLILNSQAGGGNSIEHWEGVIAGLGLIRIVPPEE